MSKPASRMLSLRSAAIGILLVVIAGIAALLLLSDMPPRFEWWPSVAQEDARGDDAHDDHDHHDHDHSTRDQHALDRRGHDPPNHNDQDSIELSDNARANLGLKVARIELGQFVRYVEVPAIVTPWPGRTHVSVTSPLTGVIHSIEVSRGELIRSGSPLFSLRLTHQDLVSAQEQFLLQLGQLDIENREIERLTSITRSGAVAGKALLARQYERDKLMASVRAARQAMLLHGLSEDQVREIERTRQLVREVIVETPEIHADRSLHHDSLDDSNAHIGEGTKAQLASVLQPPPVEHPPHIDIDFLVTELNVRRGQSVTAGETLAELSDYSELLIEGKAYQRDGEALRRAAESSTPVQAALSNRGDEVQIIDGLKIVYIGNEIGRESRTLPFYVALENEIEHSELRGDGRYVSWKYKPGQRLKLRLPVETLDNVIVVPKAAVAQQGAERYVFVERGNRFERVPVQVISRDSIHAALASGGKLRSGRTVAVQGAHQLQMAVKNRSGDAIDPHHGHSH